MEFNRLNPFLEEREDLRSAQIASLIHNSNVLEKEDLKTPSDFMLPTMDEVIRKDIEREQEEREAQQAKETESNNGDVQLAWKQHLKHLLRGRKPVETTIKL